MSQWPRRALVGLTLVMLVGSGCGEDDPSEDEFVPPEVPPEEIAAAAAVEIGETDPYILLTQQPDRTQDDLALDAGRRPAELLRFIDVVPGMRVAEIGAGRGYTTELLARAALPEGEVYAQNDPDMLARFLEPSWSERLARPVMQGVRRLDRPFDDPFPPDVRDLDAVVMVLFYHDTVWLDVDRARMNQAVYDALRPGGHYVIIDHSALEGAGVTEVQTLHRIEEAVVRQEVEQAGFELQKSSDFLREPDDARDWSASPRTAAERRGTSDRFALKFIKR